MLMHTVRARHYRRRLRRSKRLPYRFARLVLGAIPLLLLAVGIAYVIAGPDRTTTAAQVRAPAPSAA